MNNNLFVSYADTWISFFVFPETLYFVILNFFIYFQFFIVTYSMCYQSDKEDFFLSLYLLKLQCTELSLSVHAVCVHSSSCI